MDRNGHTVDFFDHVYDKTEAAPKEERMLPEILVLRVWYILEN
jgi:hypothetical protein